MIINASRIGAQGTGLYHFTRSVVRCLSRRTNDLAVLAADFVDFGPEIPRHPIPAWVTMTPKVSFIRPILWYVYAQMFIRKDMNHLLSTTHHPIPGIKHQIITIHDLRLLFYPDNRGQYLYFKIILKKHLRHLDALFTVSQQTKKMIQEHYQVTPDKIFIIPNCVDTDLFQPAANPGTGQRYLLSVGATWRHKNIHAIINRAEVWAGRYRLKIIAGRGTYRDYLNGLVQQAGLSDKVEFLEYVPQEGLVSLYQQAAALIYPSKMEGFGIPPLEAMACGIPVILSDLPVFREKFADIPLYVEPENQESLAQAIQALDDRPLMDVKREQGLAKAKEYSEQNLCNHLCRALEKVWPEVMDNKRPVR